MRIEAATLMRLARISLLALAILLIPAGPARAFCPPPTSDEDQAKRSFLAIPTSSDEEPEKTKITLIPIISHEDLAKRPIIVIAHWEKAPKVGVQLARPIRGNQKGERTELVVTRVIAGDVKPGRHEVILGPFITWSKEPSTITLPRSSMAFTSLNPEHPNLWFFHRDRAIRDDPREYLFVESYQGVRSDTVEPYFVALRSKEPQVEVPKLLASPDSEVVELALDWLCGGEIPDPNFEDDLPLRPTPNPSFPSRLRPEDFGAVDALLKHEDEDIRGQAVCVVGTLEGKAGIPKLRRLLTDADPNLRAMAVMMLAALDDRESGEAISTAIRGIDDDIDRVICALAAWKNPGSVPAIIGYLEDDDDGGWHSAELAPRCVLARAALKQITGHTFPLDVDVATRVWRLASKLPDAKRREEFLTRMLREEPAPLAARLVRDGDGFSITVTNTSPRPIHLPKTPESIEESYELRLADGSISESRIGGGEFDWSEITGKDSFVELEPGASTSFPYAVEEGKNLGLSREFFQAGPASRKVILSYERNGHEFGLKGWIGRVEASTDSLGTKP